MVDTQRRQVVLEANRSVFDTEEEALAHARWGIRALVGYQQLEAGDDVGPLKWVLRRLLREITERQEW
ncbi:hypothetical protein ABZ511_06165 [Nocardia gamkensis]|uniref:hypothetical protein n=1 Tax=Nocardia gamkensis TaxID=352869 RepID=UPI0033D324EE